MLAQLPPRRRSAADIAGLPCFRHTLLTPAEEQELARAIQSRAEACRDSGADPRRDPEAAAAVADLVAHNLRLALYLAERLGVEARRMPIEDAFGFAQVGLVEAAWRFSPRGIRFSTYATWWVRQAIGRGEQPTNFACPLPAGAAEIAAAIRRGKDRKGLTPTRRAKILHDAAIAHGVTFLPEGPDGSPQGWHLVGREPSPTEAVEAEEARGREAEALRRALGRMDARDRSVLALRFGLDGQGVRTLDRIGRDLGLTRERVRQVEAEALARLRTLLAAPAAGRAS